MTRDPSRRGFLSALGGLTAAASTPTFVSMPAFSSTLTELALDEPAEQRSAGTLSHPRWFVSYSEGSKDSLESWIDQNTSRELRRDLDSLDMMVVSAPAHHIGLSRWNRITDSGLQGASYVESIDADISMGLPEPVGSLDDDVVWDFDEPRFRPFADAPKPDGVAFDEDANPTPIADAEWATNAETVAASGDGLLVGVIDTGVNHDSLFETDGGVARIVEESKNFITGETVGASGMHHVADENGHGTWVASALAANSWSNEEEFNGFLPASDILALKALDDDGSGATEDIAAAVEYATDQGVDVLCMSLGSALWSDALDDALEYAVENNTVPVVAVGNDRFGTTWTASPADSEHCIAVAATNIPESGDRDDTKSAYFSNIGPDPGTGDLSGGASAGATPDVAAPGMQMTALVHDTNGMTSEETNSGTSMTGPTVAGCVGRLMEVEGLSEFDVIKDRLTEHARPLPNAAVSEVGNGLVDLQAAVDETDRDDQSEAMNSTAESRDSSYDSLSNAQGGFITSLF